MLLAGLSWVVVTEIYSAVMQRCFQDTDNKVGKGFAILGIYVFAVGYCKLPSSYQSRMTLIHMCRRLDQSSNLALRRRSLAHVHQEQDHGCGCSITLYS